MTPEDIEISETWSAGDVGVVTGTIGGLGDALAREQFIMTIANDDERVESVERGMFDPKSTETYTDLKQNVLDKSELGLFARQYFSERDEYRQCYVDETATKADKGVVTGILRRGFIRANWFILQVDLDTREVESEELIGRGRRYQKRLKEVM